MAHGSGTKHHKIHGIVGWGLIIGLPFAIGSAVKAVGGGSQGFVDWLSNPMGGHQTRIFRISYDRLDRPYI